MYRNSNIYKIVSIFVLMTMAMACSKEDAAVVDDVFGATASVETRVSIAKSDFSNITLYYPDINGNYQSRDITNWLSITNNVMYLRGDKNDFYWSDVYNSPAAQLYLTCLYKDDEVWGSAIAGEKTLKFEDNYYRHGEYLEFNSLGYRYSSLKVVVKTKESTDSLNGDVLRLSFATYKKTDANSYLKKHVAHSTTDTIRHDFSFSGWHSSFTTLVRKIPEQTLTDVTRILLLSYSGIDYEIDLSSLPVSRSNATDTSFKYLAGEAMTVNISIQPSAALNPQVSVDISGWNSVTSLGSAVGDYIYE